MSPGWLRLARFPKRLLVPGAEFSASMEWTTGSSIGIARDSIGLHLTFACDGEPRRQTIGVVHRPRHFGGHLACMLCPACGRGVRIWTSPNPPDTTLSPFESVRTPLG